MATIDEVAKYHLLSPEDGAESDEYAQEATAATRPSCKRQRSLFRQPLFWSTILLSLAAAFGWLGLFISIRNQRVDLECEDQSLRHADAAKMSPLSKCRQVEIEESSKACRLPNDSVPDHACYRMATSPISAPFHEE